MFKHNEEIYASLGGARMKNHIKLSWCIYIVLENVRTTSLVVTKYSNEASIQTHEQLETSQSRLVQLRRITQKFRFHWIFQTLCTLERART